MDNRKDARFPVQFRSSFSSANIVSGNGVLGDLSIRGCRVFSKTQVKPGTEVELRIEVSTEGVQLQVKKAIVRWSRDSSFGLEFINLSGDEWARLREVVHELGKESWQQDEQSDPAA